MIDRAKTRPARARRLLLLVGEVGPVEAHLARQGLRARPPPAPSIAWPEL